MIGPRGLGRASWGYVGRLICYSTGEAFGFHIWPTTSSQSRSVISTYSNWAISSVQCIPCGHDVLGQPHHLTWPVPTYAPRYMTRPEHSHQRLASNTSPVSHEGSCISNTCMYIHMYVCRYSTQPRASQRSRQFSKAAIPSISTFAASDQTMFLPTSQSQIRATPR